MEIGPPIATDASPAVATFRPSAPRTARPGSALCFGSSVGSTQKRPSTARGTTAAASLHRKLQHPTAEWCFLEKPAGVVTPRTRSGTPGRHHRPATSRERSVDSEVDLPKRPATARAPSSLSRRSKRGGIDCEHVRIQPVELTDTRAIREAAQREHDQVNYSDPLRGKSVEPRTVEMAVRSCASVQNAVSLSDSSRVKAFQARAKGDYTRAIKHLRKAVEVEPSDHLSLFQLAVAYERTGDLQHALAAYEKVISLEEDNSFAYFNAANILMQLSKLDDAIRHYSAAIQRCSPSDPHQLEFFRQRGAAYRKKGDFEKAARDYAHCHSKSALTRKQDKRPCEADAESSTDTGSERSTNDALLECGPSPTMSKLVYSSDTLYAPLEQSEIPFDAWTRERVFRIARSSPPSRTTSDLLLLADTLRALFPFCSILSPDACTALATKLVGAASVHPGTPLFLEKMVGSHVFFVYRGRVSVHKTVVQHIEQVAQKTAPVSDEEESDTGDMTSWESVYAEMEFDHQQQQQQSDTNERALDASIRRIAAVTHQWAKRQMRLCQFGHGSVVGFQGRHTSDARCVSHTPVFSQQLCSIDVCRVQHVLSYCRRRERLAFALVVGFARGGEHSARIRGWKARAHLLASSFVDVLWLTGSVWGRRTRYRGSYARFLCSVPSRSRSCRSCRVTYV